MPPKKNPEEINKSWWQKDLDWVDEVKLIDGEIIDTEDGSVEISLEGFVITEEGKKGIRKYVGPISSILWVAGEVED